MITLPPGSILKRISILLAPLVALTSCLSDGSVNPTPTGQTDPTSTETTDPPSKPCVLATGGSAPVNTGSASGDALHLSGEVFLCAQELVIAGDEDINVLAAAAQLASAVGGPLLLPHPQLAAELGRLKPSVIYVLGGVAATTPPQTEVRRLTTLEAVDLAAEALGVTIEVRLPATPDASTIVETIRAMAARDRVVLPQSSPGTTDPTTSQAIDVATVVESLASPTESETLWLVEASDPAAILTTAAIARSTGATVVPVDGTDLFAFPELGDVLAGRPPGAIRAIGNIPEGSDWELRVLAGGHQVPGGGYQIFPDGSLRRFLAFYGHPETSALGALGEQPGPRETLQRMQPFLDAYGADGAHVIPTFEIIATVASAGATEDGNYSFEWPSETFAEWVEAAAEIDGYVVLDLQPGRTDFLTQAMRYEDLLRLPHVGLALDPEWRLKPDQVHLRQIGRVSAAEVNTVVDWLADLVNSEGIPQKLFIVHQFRDFMIEDRATLAERKELAMVIQMDGQGPIHTKDETYRVLTSGTQDNHWRWGWKNFFRMDEPTPSPEHTLGKDPVPVFVSYQ